MFAKGSKSSGGSGAFSLENRKILEPAGLDSRDYFLANQDSTPCYLRYFCYPRGR